MRRWLKKSATDVRIYVNFPSEFEPIEARYGSTLEKTNSTVRSGKGGTRCLVVDRLRASRREPVKFEDFEVRVRCSQTPGAWTGWTTVFAHGSVDDCGVSRFALHVHDQPAV